MYPLFISIQFNDGPRERNTVSHQTKQDLSLRQRELIKR